MTVFFFILPVTFFLALRIAVSSKSWTLIIQKVLKTFEQVKKGRYRIEWAMKMSIERKVEGANNPRIASGVMNRK